MPEVVHMKVEIAEDGTKKVLLAAAKSTSLTAEGSTIDYENCDPISTFEGFAASQCMEPFMREVLNRVEVAEGLRSYHMRVVPWVGGLQGQPGGRPGQTREIAALLAGTGAEAVRLSAAAHGFLVYCVGDNGRERDVPIVEDFDALDAPICYEDASFNKIEVAGLFQRDVVVLGAEPQAVVRCSLDWQGRPCIVAAMAPSSTAARAARALGEPVRRQTELNTEELAALWRSVAQVVAMHGSFQDIRLNEGSFKNVAHLHVKVFIEQSCFSSVWSANSVYQLLLEARQHRRSAH